VIGHVPVMPAETIDALAPAAGASLLDGTLGLGGHALAWLEATSRLGRTGCVVGIDRDRAALSEARNRLDAAFPGCASTHHGSYEEAPAAVAGAGLGAVDAALLDLGASSLQLDSAERGFSFRAPGPLDMRMDPGAGGETAADVVNRRSVPELARVFAEYGEEPMAERVATAIAVERARAPFRDTLRLAEAVSRAVGGRRGKLHPATRVFQALRIEVNDEMGRLRRGLPAVASTVREGGRFAVISFHRLEDREVKVFFRDGAGRGEFENAAEAAPARAEVRANPRSRSARLRAVQVVRRGEAEAR
jgi:16S rRNA (cytosine1402-N4)-methyltransferase